MDTDGAPIPGLYAAGELVGGLFYFNYPGGTGLMNGSVFGRIAGTTADNARRSRRERNTRAVIPAQARPCAGSPAFAEAGG